MQTMSHRMNHTDGRAGLTPVIKTLSNIIPLLFGLISACCRYVAEHAGELCFDDPLLPATMVLFSSACVTFFKMLDWTLNNYGRIVNRPNRVFPIHVRRFLNQVNCLELTISRKVISVCAAFILICWAPYLIRLFPGIYWSDTTWQISDAFNLNYLSDHHPYFDTIIIGAFAKLGDIVSGKPIYGTYLLVILNSMLSALSFSILSCGLSQYGCKSTWQITLLVFFAINPLFPIFLSSLCKDTLHLPWIVLFGTLFCHLWKTRHAGQRESLFYFFVCLMCCLTKKIGIIIVTSSTLALLMRMSSQKSRLSIISAVLSWMLLSQAILPSTVSLWRNIAPGGKQEMLSVPLQQVANVIRKNPGSLTNLDWKTVTDSYLYPAFELPTLYNWMAADGVKGYTQPPNANYRDFIALWARLGIINPTLYLESAAGLWADWFYPASSEQLTPILESRTECDFTNGLGGWDPAPQAGDDFGQTYRTIRALPIISLMFYKSLYATAIPAYLLYRALRAKDRMLRTVFLAPILMHVAALLVGPVSIWQEGIRYVFPLVALCPFFCLVLLDQESHIN